MKREDAGPLGHKTVDDDYDGMYKDTEYTVSFKCIKCEIEFELPEEKVKGKQVRCPLCKRIIKNKGVVLCH